MKAHLLYVEDDESLSFVTRDNLELQGYKITYCPDGKTALDEIRNQNFDLCILDVMLPEVDGFALAQEIRHKDTQVPIIFLSAKSLKEDKLQGLRLGADDYMTKPFSIEELMLKIDVFLRRSKIVSNEERQKIQDQHYKIGTYNFDYKNLELKYNQESRTLTQKEADLLRLLIVNKNEVIKRSELLEKIWGEDDYFMGRSMDVFISRLRKYLINDENIKITNIHGVGFRMTDTPE
ncbi:MAG: response regulator transcription factor [Saprospiraceae bacterium]|jgi:DNA-binding response OmpR family regulator|nr:response regulator transcription factor [Saprospiraceae bacterium]